MTLSPEDSRVNHSQQPESEKAQQITVTSGRKCLEQFGRLVPDGSWAKTFSELLIGMEGWYSSRCNLIWKLKGTKSKRMYIQLAVSTPRTNDTERGLLLKTPSAMDARSERLTKKEQRFGNSGTLAQEVQTGFIYKRGLLPTPTASSCAKGGCTRKDPKRQNDTLACAIHAIFGERGSSSQLNPLFVSEMMGFPYLWTELPFQSGEQNQSKPTETR